MNVLTANYGNDRTNANPEETVLATANVAPGSFGKIGAFAVDGQIHAQPLVVTGVTIEGVARNVVYVATMHNSVYAFDAEDTGRARPLWQVNLGPSVPAAFLSSFAIQVEVGILSTPVIDLSRNAIYVVSDTFERGAAVFRLHALDLSDGSEKPGSPAEIKAEARGDGDASQDGKIALDPAQHIQRPGLLLANDRVYIAFGSHEDAYPYHGWVLAYDASDVRRQVAVFNTTPRGGGASVWQSGRGPAADRAGNIYVATGNGDYDGKVNFGESFLKLNPDLALLDWFTPSNFQYLNDGDYDLGSLGPVLIPGTELLLGGDKAGNVYLVDSSKMGQLGGGAAPPQIFQGVAYGGIFNVALWSCGWEAMLYVTEAGDWTGAYLFSGARMETALATQGPVNADIPYQGMAISANGCEAGSGILWMTTGDFDKGGVPGTLHAFDALDLSNELWNSNLDGDAGRLGAFAKFVAPTVANGRVYVATFSNQLAVYGLTN